MGIDVSNMLETQPKTYELLQLLYCCNLTNDMGVQQQEQLIQDLANQINTV